MYIFSKSNKRRRFFTVTELVVAMGVFAILSVMLLCVFSGTQDVFQSSVKKTETDENARLALDMIEDDIRDIVNLNYTGNKETNELNSSFVSYSQTAQDANDFSMVISGSYGKLYQVRYYYSTTTDSTKPGIVSRAKSTTELTVLPTSLSTISADATAAPLLENVVSFSVSRYVYNASNGTAVPSSATTFPDIVIIKINLIAPEDAEKYSNASDADKPKYVRSYSRTVILSSN